MRTVGLLAVSLVVLPCMAGCARYEYDLVAPPEAAGHIGEQNDYVFTRGHLVYRLRSVENYLVIRIENPGND
ncbi:MAG TPA: hypothetical protein VN541_04190, partial [Tepidisphaeraceae bacterium]|nr:hypothetical protein [Tepidisphaeraceae bacterium]